MKAIVNVISEPADSSPKEVRVQIPLTVIGSLKRDATTVSSTFLIMTPSILLSFVVIALY